MDALRIKGGVPLSGTIDISGSKNASLPIMAAALLAPGESQLDGTPDLVDVRTLAKVLAHMGVGVSFEGGSLKLDATNVDEPEAPYELVRTMRASILVLGPLVARYGHARVSLPGGCAIGARLLARCTRAAALVSTVHDIRRHAVLALPNRRKRRTHTADALRSVLIRSLPCRTR